MEEKIIKTIEGKHGCIIEIVQPKNEPTKEYIDGLYKLIATLLIEDHLEQQNLTTV